MSSIPLVDPSKNTLYLRRPKAKGDSANSINQIIESSSSHEESSEKSNEEPLDLDLNSSDQIQGNSMESSNQLEVEPQPRKSKSFSRQRGETFANGAETTKGGKIRNKLGQIKRVGFDEYNQRIVRMIKDKYHEELERVDHVDLCDPQVTLLDLRERSDYIKGHIHNAINIPASKLIKNEDEEHSFKHASKVLLESHIDSLIKYSVNRKQSHVFIFYYYSKHRMYSFFEFRRMRKLLRRAIRLIEKTIYPQSENSRPNFHVCVAERK